MLKVVGNQVGSKYGGVNEILIVDVGVRSANDVIIDLWF